MASMRAVTKGSPQPDPVGGLRFKVELQPDLNVGRFMECTGLSVEVETKEYMEGGSNDFVHKLPTRVKYPNIVLKRGVTHEEALLQWFLESRFTPQRRDMTISLLGPGLKNRQNGVSLPWLTGLARASQDPMVGTRGANVAYWRADAVRVNGYNEAFEGWGREDSEFAARLLAAGCTRRKLKFGGVVRSMATAKKRPSGET